jgi:hypothetical protein
LRYLKMVETKIISSSVELSSSSTFVDVYLGTVHIG